MGATKEVFAKEREKEMAMEDSTPFMEFRKNIKNVITRAKKGELSRLDAVIKLRENRRQMEAVLSDIKKYEDDELEEIAMDAANYPEGYKGYQFEYRNGRKLWNFKSIPEYNKYSEKLKEVQEAGIAAFELFQKTGSKPITEDGELLPMPELNYAKSSLVVKKLKKK